VHRSISRRRFGRGAAAFAAAAGISSFAGPWRVNRAFAKAKPIHVGLTCDATGLYGFSGQDDLRGIRLAIAEINAKGGVLGRPIEAVTHDTETNPQAGARVARVLIKQEDCSLLIGAIHSEVAQAITGIASASGVIYLNTNSSAASQAQANCNRVKFVWDANGTNFAKAAVMNAVAGIGHRWVLLANDSVWGRNAQAATRILVQAAGGYIPEEFLIPESAGDFLPVLRRIRAINPDVVATAVGGSDFQVLRKQVVAAGMATKPAWLSSQQDWPDIWAVRGNVFGAFGTTWYHKLKLPGVADFVRRWRNAYPRGGVPVPGNVSYNGYMATRELFAAMQRVGSTNNIAVIKELERLVVPAAARMQHFDAHMNPLTHHLQQTIYLARRNAKPVDETDLFEIVSWSPPQAVTDPAAEAICRLAPYDQVPVVDS
jgi:branched-chain amino acid transport system substrate-binding protein